MNGLEHGTSQGAVTDETKLFADMWLRQSDLFLKLAALVPVLEIAILAGWYALIRDQQPELARGAALFGTIVMTLALMILWRASRRVLHFRQRIGALLNGLPQAVVTGRWTAVALPAICIAVNGALALGVIEPRASPAKLPAPPNAGAPAAPAK